MRKFHIPMLALFAVIAAAVPAAAQSAPKYAYINSQRIIAEAPGAQSARQALERDMEGYRKELGALEEEIRKLITDYEQKQSMLSAEAKRQQEQQIQQKQNEYRQRAAQLEEQYGRRQQELVEPVMKQIQDVIDALRKEGNYAMIFDAASGAIISADTALDLTDQVLTRLKATAKP
jgi:outer membrane protein